MNCSRPYGRPFAVALSVRTTWITTLPAAVVTMARGLAVAMTAY
jgi:hypothetical protein